MKRLIVCMTETRNGRALYRVFVGELEPKPGGWSLSGLEAVKEAPPLIVPGGWANELLGRPEAIVHYEKQWSELLGVPTAHNTECACGMCKAA